MRPSSKFVALAAIAMLTSLTACVDDESAPSGPSALITPPIMNTRPATFVCDNAGSVVVRPVGEDGKNITLATRRSDIKLRLVPADQGRKYSDGQTVFWINGPNARLLLEGQQEPEDCKQR
ncbi:MAG: MliC family protein [Alphaproteobacteria bacterium]|nr:MliC family protein [Alphaproteobacteria bacterium]